MIPTPYPHQSELRVNLRTALRTSVAVLAFSPTGSGKTNLAAMLIAALLAARKRVLFLVHRVDLLRQTASTFDRFNIPYSYIAAGHHHNIYRLVNIASIPTLANRLGKYPADYVFVDEAHLSASGGWAKTINHYKEQGAKIIGLTGSPIRLDGKPLGAVWDTMVMGPSTRWLIENGFLSKYRPFAPASPDLSGVHTRNGDYVQSEIEDIMTGGAVLAGAVRHWKKYAAGKRTIAFAPSVKASQQLAADFRANGVMAVHVDGETPQEERLKAFEAFADRQIEVLTNCLLWTEGFDLAAQVGRPCTIECVLDYSPTQSVARHLQKYGRGLRYDGGEPHILLDLVGGFAKLGLPDEEREWSLDGTASGKKRGPQEQFVKVCPSCFAAHEPAPKCPECGHVYTVEERTVSMIDGDLAEIDIEAVRARKVAEQGSARSLDDLVRLATARGYKSPEKWASHVFTARAARQGVGA